METTCVEILIILFLFSLTQYPHGGGSNESSLYADLKVFPDPWCQVLDSNKGIDKK